MTQGWECISLKYLLFPCSHTLPWTLTCGNCWRQDVGLTGFLMWPTTTVPRLWWYEGHFLTAAEDLTHQLLKVLLDVAWVLWLPSNFQRRLFPECLGPTNKAILHGSSYFRLCVSHLLGLQLMEGVKCFISKGRLCHTGKPFFPQYTLDSSKIEEMGFHK